MHLPSSTITQHGWITDTSFLWRRPSVWQFCFGSFPSLQQYSASLPRNTRHYLGKLHRPVFSFSNKPFPTACHEILDNSRRPVHPPLPPPLTTKGQTSHYFTKLTLQSLGLSIWRVRILQTTTGCPHPDLLLRISENWELELLSAVPEAGDDPLRSLHCY